MTADDAFHLERFVAAQQPVYEAVVRELRAGHKRTHWMWFIFPQHRGLGRSSTAEFFGIASLAEARAFIAHPTLGTRLVACAQMVLAQNGQSLPAIFGIPDDAKFRSSMTLFAVAMDSPNSVFWEALQRYCDGIPDDRTLSLLGATAASAASRPRIESATLV